MKIGIVADIHSNLPALNAVMAALSSVDIIVCAGDIIGYYNKPNETCSLIRERASIVVRGNHENLVSKPQNLSAPQKELLRNEWTKSVLTYDNFRWVETLPTTQDINVDGYTITVRHTLAGGEYYYPDSPAIFKLHLQEKSVIIIGHTHHPMIKKCGAGIVINPGSVGQPRDCNPDPSYAIFDTNTGDVEFLRAQYDIALLQEELSFLGWNKMNIQRLLTAFPAKYSPLAKVTSCSH